MFIFATSDVLKIDSFSALFAINFLYLDRFSPDKICWFLGFLFVIQEYQIIHRNQKHIFDLTLKQFFTHHFRALHVAVEIKSSLKYM